MSSGPHRQLDFERAYQAGTIVEEDERYQWIAVHILPHEGDVRGWLRRYVHGLSGDEINDIVREVYARVWMAEPERISDPLAYLYAIVRRVLADRATEPVGPSASGASGQADPERATSSSHERDQIVQIISTLSPPCRRAFELHKFEGLSVRDVAEEMGITEATVARHLTKALARILVATHMT